MKHTGATAFCLAALAGLLWAAQLRAEDARFDVRIESATNTAVEATYEMHTVLTVTDIEQQRLPNGGYKQHNATENLTLPVVTAAPGKPGGATVTSPKTGQETGYASLEITRAENGALRADYVITVTPLGKLYSTKGQKFLTGPMPRK